MGFAAAVMVLAVHGCSAPSVDGYQLQGTPQGFLYTALQARNPALFRDRPVEAQGMWVGDIHMDEPETTIMVTTYAGPSERMSVEAVREARARQVADFTSIMVGPVRDLALVGGGTGWVWTEERYNEYGRLRSLNVSGAASFDSVSFALDFNTSEPARMTQAHADAILATFALGRTTIHWNALAAVTVLLVVLAGWLVRRMRPRHSSRYRLWEKGPPPKSPEDVPQSPPPTPPADPS